MSSSGSCPNSSRDEAPHQRHARRAADQDHAAGRPRSSRRPAARAAAAPRALEQGRDQRVELRARPTQRRLLARHLRDVDRRLAASVNASFAPRAASSTRAPRRDRACLGHARAPSSASAIARSMSSPPSAVSPPVDFTWNTPSRARGSRCRTCRRRDRRRRTSPLPLVEPVGQRRRGRLVEQPQHLEPREPPRVARRLPLGVVEVRRHRDHRAARSARQRRLGARPQHPEDLRRALDRRHRRAPFTSNRTTLSASTRAPSSSANR